MRTEDDWKQFVGDQLRGQNEKHTDLKDKHDILALRVGVLETKLQENTDVTKRTEEKAGLILDAMGGLAAFGKFCKWFSIVAAPIITLWLVWKGKA